MTDTTTPETSGTNDETTLDQKTLADWMRITQRAFMRRMAEQFGDEGIDMRAALAARLHGDCGPEADKLRAAAAAVQQQATASVSDEDLATTLRTLEAIARELGWTPDATGFGRGRGFGPGRDFDPRRGFGPGRGPWGRGGRGFDPRHGSEAPHHGGHGHGRGGHPKRERAYERGFEAGFEAAQRHQSTPPTPAAPPAPPTAPAAPAA